MTKVGNKEMSEIMKNDLKLHGPLSDIGLEVDQKEIDIDGPQVGVKVKPVEKDVAQKLASIGAKPGNDKKKEPKIQGKVLTKEKQAEVKLNPKLAQSGEAKKETTFASSTKKPLTQKELKWRKKVEKMLTEVMAKKNMVKTVYAENLPQKIKERLIKEAAIKGDANTPIGSTNDAQTSKKAGWERNPWSSSLKKAFERWGDFMEGPGIRPSGG